MQTNLNFNWKVIQQHEGDSLIPYAIPGSVGGKSGVTIAQGVDLANISPTATIINSYYILIIAIKLQLRDDPNLIALYNADASGVPGSLPQHM